MSEEQTLSVSKVCTREFNCTHKLKFYSNSELKLKQNYQVFYLNSYKCSVYVLRSVVFSDIK